MEKLGRSKLYHDYLHKMIKQIMIKIIRLKVKSKLRVKYEESQLPLV